MNANIQILNGGKQHKPIWKIRKYETGEKFAIGRSGINSKKFVEAAKGTKLYTLVYEKTNEDGSTIRKLVPLMLQDVIEAQARSGRKWKEYIDKRVREEGILQEDWIYKFTMSPGDLVYAPLDEEIKKKQYEWAINRIYKVVSLDDENPNFIPANVASVILDGKEYKQQNKSPEDAYGRLIKKICIPIKVDRLGNIKSIML